MEDSAENTKKRRADDASNGGDAQHDDQSTAKRAKVGDNAVDLSVLEKAKKALEMQKELKAKLERLKQAKQATTTKPPTVTAGSPTEDTQPQHQQQQETQFEKHDSRFFDPSLGTTTLKRMNRRARPAINFVEEGAFQKAAEISRLAARYGEDYVKQLEERKRKEEQIMADGLNPNLIPIGTRGTSLTELAERDQRERPIPDVEWWDARLLKDKTSYDANRTDEVAFPKEKYLVRADKITNLVEHPVLLEPPLEPPPPPPQPLKLTQKELKKLRKQRRQAREEEKQELIRQGLLEPPKPKVKISNLMRVLGAEATADPTAIEAEVRRQMAERAAAHEDRNLARMLTPAERREKKLQRLLDAPRKDEEGRVVAETLVAVYRVKDITSKRLRFKVEANARENHLTGMAVIVPGLFAVVVVEGGPKTLRRYEKLMLKRIDWNAGGADAGDGDGDASSEGKKNYCYLVWSGMVKEPAFKGKFRTDEVMSEFSARRVFEERKVAHYWDIAAAYEPE